MWQKLASWLVETGRFWSRDPLADTYLPWLAWKVKLKIQATKALKTNPFDWKISQGRSHCRKNTFGNIQAAWGSGWNFEIYALKNHDNCWPSVIKKKEREAKKVIDCFEEFSATFLLLTDFHPFHFVALGPWPGSLSNGGNKCQNVKTTDHWDWTTEIIVARRKISWTAYWKPERKF